MLRQLVREQRTERLTGLWDLRARVLQSLGIVADREVRLFGMMQSRLESAKSLDELVALLKVKQSLIGLLETRSEMVNTWADAFDTAENAMAAVGEFRENVTLRGRRDEATMESAFDERVR